MSQNCCLSLTPRTLSNNEFSNISSAITQLTALETLLGEKVYFFKTAIEISAIISLMFFRLVLVSCHLFLSCAIFLVVDNNSNQGYFWKCGDRNDSFFNFQLDKAAVLVLMHWEINEQI